MQQRVAFAGGLAQVLIQVTQEAGVPSGVGEVVRQGAGVGIDLLPELAQRHGGVTADADAEDGVVYFVEEGAQAGQGTGFAE